MRRLLFFLLFIAALGVGLTLARMGQLRDVYQTVCDLTQEHFYRQDPKLDKWVKACYSRAAKMPLFASVDFFMGDVQVLMNELNVSHFQIYNPDEDRELWKGEGLDTGIRARYIEDHLVVYRVAKDSAGATAGVMMGDDIVEITGTDQVTPWGAAHRSGQYKVRRGPNELILKVESQDMVADMSVKLTRLTDTTMVLEIPSFRSEFFQKQAWQKTVAEFKNAKHLIVDVRENPGGNFVAMMRALSTFHCKDKKIGRLVQSRKSGSNKAKFDDNTDDGYQIQELEDHRNIGLVTYSDYGCYTGQVTVLISNETSSTAEIFADSFLERPNSRVWGQPSAGDVVLAVWYDLPALGPGFSLSIPQAVYESVEGQQLEGAGVWPQRELIYKLKSALLGKDNWVLEAAATH